MRPSRRRFLQTLAGGVPIALAGCSTLASPRNAETSLGPTATGDPDGLSDRDISFDVTVLDQSTGTHPARIRLELENTSSTVLTIYTGVMLFTNIIGVRTSGFGKLVIYPPGADLVATETAPDEDARRPTPTTPIDGCWQLRPEVLLPATMLIHELEPGEGISYEYLVYDHRDNEACMPAGEYEFSEGYGVAVGSQRKSPRSTPSEYSLQIDFSLTINEVGKISGTDNSLAIAAM